MKYLGADSNGLVVQYKFETNDPSKVLILGDEFFLNLGFKKLGHVGNKSTYEKGSRIMRLLFGAFITYHKHELLYEVSENLVNVKLINGSSGLSGGLIGMNKAKADYKRVSEQLNNFYVQKNS